MHIWHISPYREQTQAIMFDSTLKRLTLCVRFTVEFPLSPPEVWLRRPRMRYPSGQTGGERHLDILDRGDVRSHKVYPLFMMFPIY